MNRGAIMAFARSLLSFLLTIGCLSAARGESAELSGRVSRLLGFTVTHHGPNCWNSALVAAGVLKHIRFTSPEEFRFLVESPLCQKIPSGQQRSGDIQVYRRTLPGLSGAMLEVHANLWLNAEEAFNKMTDFSTAPYELAAHEKVNLLYGRTPEILRFNLDDVKHTSLQCQGESCRNSIEYRRCDGGLSLRPEDASAERMLLLQDQLESAIEAQVRSPFRASEKWKTEARVRLEQWEQEIQRHCRDRRSFLCEASRQARASIEWQLKRPQPNWLEPAPLD